MSALPNDDVRRRLREGPFEVPSALLADEPAAIDLDDRRVQVRAVVQLPRLVVFGNLLSHDECEDLVALSQARLSQLLRWPVADGEGLQVLRYGPGQQYQVHHDYFDPTQPGTDRLLRLQGQRVATLLMYLRAPERGGATAFPYAGLEVAPEPGSAVFFSYDRAHPSTRTLHAGKPVLAGEKYVATKWFLDRHWTPPRA